MSDETVVEVLNPEIVKTQIADVVKASGIAEDAALALRGQFADYYRQIVEWRGKAAMVTKPEDSTHQKIARDVRLGLRSIRCEVETTRKALKADSLARGKAIDGFANVLKYLCEPIEEKLMAVEQFAERQEAQRIAALVADRASKIALEGADPVAYNLGAMDDATFEMVLNGIRKAKADAAEAARKAEAERVAKEQADTAERERVRKENETLKAEAAKREAEAAKERKRIEAERKKERDAAEAKQRETEAKAKAEREAAASKLREVEAKARAENEARIKAERAAEFAKKQEEIRAAEAKAAAEAKLIAERKAAVKAMRAPDKDKIIAFADALRESPVMAVMATEDGKRVADFVLEKRKAFCEWIVKQADQL